jgi:hypothetical protein
MLFNLEYFIFPLLLKIIKIKIFTNTILPVLWMFWMFENSVQNIWT